MLLESNAGAVVIVKRMGSRPARTWLQWSGIDTGAPSRMRYEERDLLARYGKSYSRWRAYLVR